MALLFTCHFLWSTNLSQSIWVVSCIATWGVASVHTLEVVTNNDPPSCKVRISMGADRLKTHQYAISHTFSCQPSPPIKIRNTCLSEVCNPLPSLNPDESEATCVQHRSKQGCQTNKPQSAQAIFIHCFSGQLCQIMQTCSCLASHRLAIINSRRPRTH